MINGQELTPQTRIAEKSSEIPFVFMGGIGYDENRNRRVGQTAIALTDHEGVVTIPDFIDNHGDTAVFKLPDGSEMEMPSKQAMRQLDRPVEARYTRLHEQRAEQLIEGIEKAGGKPVDAVFQSVDTSTGILAMWKRPDLFRKVVLLDPSSIVKLPRRRDYLREEWQNGNLRDVMRHKDATGSDRFEDRVSRKEARNRTKLTSRNGNMNASYLSYQAQMLHEIAQSKEAPSISIVASRFDHAYTPERILDSLARLDDVDFFYITNSRHGLGGKKGKLDEVVSVLGEKHDRSRPFIERLKFADGIDEEYRRRITKIVQSRALVVS